MQKKDTNPPIQNEADNGLTNDRGTVAMARTGDPHSATAQFFINSKDNTFLNHTGKDVKGWGYAVFGKVIEGMEVVDAISAVQTTNQGGMGDVPVEPITITRASAKAMAE
jgi:peptidyl-prolyl cis-trans isomerase B (cyclophilin B)